MTNSTLGYYINRDHPEYALIAALDESESYEVDVSEIWRKPDGAYALATASGCSCWDGDYEIAEFPTLGDLAKSLSVTGDEYQYGPSQRGAAELLRDAYGFVLGEFTSGGNK